MTLVIGVGNRLRRDDGAGLAVARRMGGVEYDGDPLSLLDLWEPEHDVVLIDAARPRQPPAPGRVWAFDAVAAPLPVQELRSSSSHALGLPHAVELARALRQLPRRLHVYAIEGRDFGHGDGFSIEVADAVAALAGELAAADTGG